MFKAIVFSLALLSLLHCSNASLIVKAKKTNKLLSVTELRGGMGGDVGDAIDWRFFVTGSICAAASHGITTPLDVIKTCIQTNPEKYNKGFVKAGADIVASNGVGFLLAGLGPTVIGYSNSNTILK